MHSSFTNLSTLIASSTVWATSPSITTRLIFSGMGGSVSTLGFGLVVAPLATASLFSNSAF